MFLWYFHALGNHLLFSRRWELCQSEKGVMERHTGQSTNFRFCQRPAQFKQAVETLAGLSQLFLPLRFTFPWRSNQKANLHLHGTFIIITLF